MISIVVCSVNEERFNRFSQSVQSSIGLPYEIIRIDNRKNEYSICGAYNKGKSMCSYEVICFSHEDVIFETKNWGQILLDILKDPAIGLVGIFGACFYSLFPHGWVDFDETEGQMIVGALENNPLKRHIRFPSDSIAEVAGVDGIFMVSRKSIMKETSFSDDILEGFHGYDIDLSMQIRQQYKIVVTRDILLYHESGGKFNDSYFEAMKALEKKWHNHFPVYISSYSKPEIQNLKIKSLYIYYQKIVEKNNSVRNHLIAARYAIRHKIFFAWLKKSLRTTFHKKLQA